MNVPWEIPACILATLAAIPIWFSLARQNTSSTRITLGRAFLLPVMAGATGWRFADDPALTAWWWAGLHTMPLAVLDLQQHRLPRAWLASLATGGVGLFGVVSAVHHESGSLLRAVLAGFGVWLVMRLVETVCAGRMGGGDTRLHAVLAVYTGWISWHTVLLGLLVGTVLLGAGAGLAVLLGRRGRSSRIAAGPFLLTGAWLAVVLTAL